MINNNLTLTSTQIESHIMEQNKGNIILVPTRNKIQNIVRNARKREKIDDFTLLKNVKLSLSFMEKKRKNAWPVFQTMSHI